MKAFFLFLLLFVSLGCNRDRTVYICDSRTAYRYHLKANCRGLINCTHPIRKMTQREAEKLGRTLCGYEK